MMIYRVVLGRHATLEAAQFSRNLQHARKPTSEKVGSRNNAPWELQKRKSKYLEISSFGEFLVNFRVGVCKSECIYIYKYRYMRIRCHMHICMHTYIPACFFYIRSSIHTCIHRYIVIPTEVGILPVLLSALSRTKQTDLFLENNQPGMGPDLIPTLV